MPCVFQQDVVPSNSKTDSKKERSECRFNGAKLDVWVPSSKLSRAKGGGQVEGRGREVPKDLSLLHELLDAS